MKHYRVLIPAGAVLLALFLVGSASAFECYNASRSDRGNERAANSQALASFEEILVGEVGLCPAGVEHVLEGLELAGFETNHLINFNALMAGGLEKNGKGGEKLHNEKGIDHLSAEFFATVGPLEEEAIAICEGAD
jgi:hypothetical protein